MYRVLYVCTWVLSMFSTAHLRILPKSTSTKNTTLCSDLVLGSQPLVHIQKPSSNSSLLLLPWWWLPALRSATSDAHVVCPEAISIKMSKIKLNRLKNMVFLTLSHFNCNEWKLLLSFSSVAVPTSLVSDLFLFAVCFPKIT